jgi:hypothetical protein
MHRRKLLLFVVVVFTSACDDSSLKANDAVRQRLVGKWLEELSADGNQIRSIITLGQDGNFTELEKIGNTTSSTTQLTHAGEWSFDGINFKRKYTSLNGQPLSNAQFGYATYAVKSFVKNEFIGVDNVRTREARFSRTEASAP